MNSKKIRTNELDIKFNIDKFLTMYKVHSFKLEKENEYDYNNFIRKSDLYFLEHSNEILSIKIKQKRLFILLKKEHKIFLDNIEGTKYVVDSDFDVLDRKNEEIIIQLLFNALPKMARLNYDYKNLGGELLYLVKSTQHKKVFLKFEIRDKKLRYSIKTFKRISKIDKKNRTKIGNKIKYEWKNGKLEIAVSINYDDNFVNFTGENKRNNIPFFIIKEKDYKQSRAYMVHQFIRRINEQFKEILNISFVEKTFYETKWRRDKYIDRKIDERIASIQFNIINNFNNEVDQQLEYMLKNAYPNIKVIRTQEIKSGNVNINLVLNKDEYKTIEEDNYKKSNIEVIQNIIISNVEKEYKKYCIHKKQTKFKSAILTKLIMESFIKQDIINQKLSLLEMYNIDASDWIFYYRKGNKYYSIEVYKDYSFEIKECDGESFYSELSIFDKSDSNRMFINITDETPLPNIDVLEEIINNKQIFDVNTADIKVLVDELFNKKNQEIFQKSLDNYNSNMISSTDIKKILFKNISSVSHSKVSEMYYKKHSKRYHNTTSMPINKKRIFDIFSDINYFEMNNNIYYFVGKMEEPENINGITPIDKGMPIRVIKNCSLLQFKKYLQLLKNDLTMVKKYSVNPCVIKYLKEYLIMNDI